MSVFWIITIILFGCFTVDMITDIKNVGRMTSDREKRKLEEEPIKKEFSEFPKLLKRVFQYSEWKRVDNQFQTSEGNFRFSVDKNEYLKEFSLSCYYQGTLIFEWCLKNNIYLLSKKSHIPPVVDFDIKHELDENYQFYLQSMKKLSKTLNTISSMNTRREEVLSKPSDDSSNLRSTYKQDMFMGKSREKLSLREMVSFIKENLTLKIIEEIPNESESRLFSSKYFQFYVLKSQYYTALKLYNDKGESVFTSVYHPKRKKLNSVKKLGLEDSLELKELEEFIKKTFDLTVDEQTSEWKDWKKEIKDELEEIQIKINSLLVHKKWMTDEEKHRLERTYPNDLKELIEAIEELSLKTEKEAKEIIEKTKLHMKTQLEEIERKIDERKVNWLREKSEVIKIR